LYCITKLKTIFKIRKEFFAKSLPSLGKTIFILMFTLSIQKNCHRSFTSIKTAIALLQKLLKYITITTHSSEISNIAVDKFFHFLFTTLCIP